MKINLQQDEPCKKKKKKKHCKRYLMQHVRDFYLIKLEIADQTLRHFSVIQEKNDKTKIIRIKESIWGKKKGSTKSNI